MSIGESHGNGRTPMRIWRSQRSHLPRHRSFFCFRYVVAFESFRSLIQFFSAVLNVRHLPRIVVLIQYVSAWENVVSMGEPHEHRRIAWEWENPMRIWGVSGVTFHVIAHSSASGTSSAFESFHFILANSVLFRRPESTPSSANHGLDSECISMGERREHGEPHEHGESHRHGRTS